MSAVSTRKSITCGTLLRTTLDPYQSAGGERFGAVVAENELIRASLAADPDLRWDFWTPGLRTALSNNGAEKSSPAADLTDLRRQFGDRVATRALGTIARHTAGGDYIFVVGLPLLPKVRQVLRQSGEGPSPPICGLLHAANLKDFSAQYQQIALSVEECDVLVATSRAGRTALERILEAAREQIARRFQGGQWKSKPPRIVDIPLGTDLPPEDALNRERARSLLRIPEDAFTALYLGRLSEEFKADLDVLLEAFAQVALKRPNSWLVLAGQALDAPYVRYLRKRLRELRLTEAAVILENFPEYLKSTLFAACDVFVSPADSIQETFGLAVLEAMAHARPVIASSWSGYRDLVGDGETGYLVRTTWSPELVSQAFAVSPCMSNYELAHYIAQRTIVDSGQLIQALESIAANPAGAREMGRRGRLRVRDGYTWPHVATRFRDLWADQTGKARDDGEWSGLVDFNSFFGHFADEVLSPGSSLALSFDPAGWDERSPGTLRSLEPSLRQGARSVLTICRSGPAPIAQLQRLGCPIDCILWLAKKGICRIIPADSSGRRL